MFDSASIERVTDLILRRVLEPGMYWVIDHPVVTVLAVGALVYWAMRGYRIL